MVPSRFFPSALLAAALVAPGCDTPTDAASATDVERVSALLVPELPAPGDFVAQVTNTYFPLVPGTVFNYAAEDGEETGVTTVTSQTKTILGVTATVVHDQVFVDGELAEDTFDWYAQDRWGNVWYLGEASCEMVDDQCASTEGSWEAGVNGAQAGIIMWADPAAHVGHTYRQEYLPDVAEDLAKVLRLGVSVEVPAGEFTGCAETMDWSPLEPGAREHKYYCPDVGLVLEMSPRGGRLRNELVGVS